MQPRAALFISIFLLIATQTSAQLIQSGPQVVTFFSDIDDTEQPYGLYVPKNYDPNKKYPLVIMLHGAGSNHRLALRRVFGKSNANGETDVEATRYFPGWADIDYIVASPFARGTAGYQGIPEKDVYDVLADVKKRFNIDEDRTYLTGLSMGGGGTLWIGLTRPDVWAALAPVCPAPPPGTEKYQGNAFNLPMHFYHGDQDSAVPVTVSRDWVKNIKDFGGKVEYDEYPGVNHNSWDNAYKDEAIFAWFGQFKRNLFPDEVRFSTAQYKYNKAYWVTINELIPATVATVTAKFSSTNELKVDVANTPSFSIKLAGHPKYAAGKPFSLTLNGKKVKVAASDSLSFVLKEGKWAQGTSPTPSGLIKKARAEGPVADAFSQRHIYVYGTADNPSPEKLKERMDIAAEGANWSVYRGAFLGRIMIFPRVIADKDVRPSDLRDCNLILLGTRETNSIIAGYADRLPMHLPADQTDLSLFYVFPVDRHYVAVNSGLPWWTAKGNAGFSFVPAPFAALGKMPDFTLFKSSSDNVLAQGYFDRNWKLGPEQVAMLRNQKVVVRE
jgi:pimeloyl-ACP methyl ester carboxylesterase